MGRRFEKQDETMTEMPEQEEAIFFQLGDKNSYIPSGKTVIDYTISKLITPDGTRILSKNINLKIKGRTYCSKENSYVIIRIKEIRF